MKGLPHQLRDTLSNRHQHHDRIQRHRDNTIWLPQHYSSGALRDRTRQKHTSPWQWPQQ